MFSLLKPSPAIATVTGLFLMALGLWGTAEWRVDRIFSYFSPQHLVQLSPALGFLLLGISLLLYSAGVRSLARGGAALVIVIGSLRLTEYLALHAGIHSATIKFSGGMGPLCALNFILSGTLLFSLQPPPFKFARLAVQVALTLTIISIALVSLFGHASENQFVYQWLRFTGFEIPTFSGFLIFGGGVLCLLVSYSSRLNISLARWMPIPVWLGVFIATLVLWEGLSDREYRQMQSITQSVVNNVKNQLNAFLTARVNTLRRLGLRWEGNDPPLHQWDQYAASLVKDFPDLVFIAWADRRHIVRAVTPSEARDILGMHLAASQLGGLTSGFSVALAAGPGTSLKALWLYIPHYENQEFKGAVVSKIDLEVWRNQLKELEPGYRIDIRTGDQAKENPLDWEKDAPFDFYNLALKIRVTPEASTLAHAKTALPGAMLATGLLLAMLAAALVFLAQTARARERETREANRRLMREIVERMRVAQSLRNSEARLAGILKMAQEAIISVDKNQRILLFNTGAEEIFGYSAEEAIGQPLRLLLPEKFIADSLATRRTQERQTEITARRKNGEEFFAEASLSKLTIADDVVYTTVLRDISERKLSGRALYESEARFKAMTANVPGVVFQLSQSQQGVLHFDYVSKGVEELLRLPPDVIEENAHRFFEKVPQEDLRNLHQARLHSATTGSRWVWEGSIAVDSENKKWISIIASLRPGDRDQKIWDGIILDESLRKLAQHEIERSREQLRSLSVHLQSIREEEKAHIAREVHDELGGTLTALKLDIAWLEKRLVKRNPELAAKAQNMAALVDTTVAATRRIVTELRPTILDDLGLVAALRWQANEFQMRTNVRCTVEAEANGELTVDKRLALVFFRIFQETLTNIARHANANEVEVKFFSDIEHYVLQIHDNGIGMDMNRVLDATSNGIRGMYERAQSASGSVDIRSAPGAGTTVTVFIPRQPLAKDPRRRSADRV